MKWFYAFIVLLLMSSISVKGQNIMGTWVSTDVTTFRKLILQIDRVKDSTYYGYSTTIFYLGGVFSYDTVMAKLKGNYDSIGKKVYLEEFELIKGDPLKYGAAYERFELNFISKKKRKVLKGKTFSIQGNTKKYNDFIVFEKQKK